MPPPARDATQQIILQKPDGEQVWLGEWSAIHEALFLATGLLDLNPASDESPFVFPVSPPPGRNRAFVVDRLIQIMDENGVTGRSKGQLFGADADGITRPIPAGNPGELLVRDPDSVTGINWVSAKVLVSDIPGQFQFGSLLNYPGEGPVIDQEVQYTKVFLTQGTVISDMTVFRTTGGSVARFVNMGLYDQVDPDEKSGEPNNKLAETGAVDTDGTFSYIVAPLGSPVTITTTGFYWIAFITDTATPLRFSQTASAFPQDFLPLWRETSSGTTLPATASSLSNPSSAVVFVGVLE